jgi:hypothetical protein
MVTFGILLPLALCTDAIGQEHLFPVTVEGKGGYIDESGKMIIAPTFIEYHQFSEGLALAGKGDFLEDGSMANGQLGYITPQGAFHKVAGCRRLGAFHEGLARARSRGQGFFSGSKWGFIDSTGAFRIEPQFDAANAFRNGLALVEVGNTRGYIDHQGKFVWQSNEGDFSSGK